MQGPEGMRGGQRGLQVRPEEGLPPGGRGQVLGTEHSAGLCADSRPAAHTGGVSRAARWRPACFQPVLP